MPLRLKMLVKIHSNSFIVDRKGSWSVVLAGPFSPLLYPLAVPQFMGASDSKEHWEEDERHPNCSKCHKAFSVTTRKHHCRSCGGVFCSECSRFRGRVPARGITDPVRLCQDCYNGANEVETKHTEREQHYMQSKQKSGLGNSDRNLDESKQKKPVAQPVEPTVAPIVQTNILAAIKDRANKQYADVSCSLAPIEGFSAPSDVQFEFSCGVDNGLQFELDFPKPSLFSVEGLMACIDEDAANNVHGVCQCTLQRAGSCYFTVTNRAALTFY